MSSVVVRIKEIKQPKGGYINPSMFTVIDLNDDMILSEEENIHASVVGMAVDYLSRFLSGAEIVDAFKIPIAGAAIKDNFVNNGKQISIYEVISYMKKVHALDDESIINACKLVTFDVWYRNSIAALRAKGAKETNPDKSTINNIRILTMRVLRFLDEYGPVTSDGFTFEKKGYTKTVDTGDGDFLTADTLWDLKVSKKKPTSDNTLQILMYYIMGKHSGQKIFKDIKKIGIFNPRLNKVFLLNVTDIPKEVIEAVEKDVICY